MTLTNQTKSDAKLAAEMDGLGHVRRIRILRALQNSKSIWIETGELARSTGLAGSTLSHHLKMMARGGLIRRKRVSRYMRVAIKKPNAMQHSKTRHELHRLKHPTRPN